MTERPPPEPNDPLGLQLRGLAASVADDGFSDRVLRRLPPRPADDLDWQLQQRQRQGRRERWATVIGLALGLAAVLGLMPELCGGFELAGLVQGLGLSAGLTAWLLLRPAR